MNKILFSFVFALFSFPTYACAQNSQEELRTLVQRVDSLEHELSYLKLNYDLKTLNYDMDMFVSEVKFHIADIKMDLYHRNFDPQYVDWHKGYYEMCQRRKQSFLEHIKSVKNLFSLKLMVSSYSEDELNVLNSIYEGIDVRYDGVKLVVDYFKALADEYARNL